MPFWHIRLSSRGAMRHTPSRGAFLTMLPATPSLKVLFENIETDDVRTFEAVPLSEPIPFAGNRFAHAVCRRGQRTGRAGAGHRPVCRSRLQHRVADGDRGRA